MRVQPWYAPVIGMLLLLSCSRDSLAQYPPQPPGATPVSGAMGHPPAAYPAPHYIPGPAGHSHLDVAPPAGYPQTMRPWPGIEMYRHNFDQHRVEDGLWKRITSDQGRRYYLGLEYINTRARRPVGIVGDPTRQSYKDEILPLLAMPPFDETDLADNFRGTVSVSTGAPGLSNEAGSPGFNYYDRVDLSHVLNHTKGDGIRIRTGWWGDDDSGIALELWWSARNSNTWSAHDTRRDSLIAPIDFPHNPEDLQAVLLQFLNSDDQENFDFGPFDEQLIFQSQLRNLRGLPVDDGSFAGTTIPYDLEFTVQHTMENYASTLNFYMTPVINKSIFKLRPIAGLRYLYVREGFSFVGRDSGAIYDNLSDTDPVVPNVKLHSLPNYIDDDQDGIIDNAGAIEDVGQGGGGGQDGEARVISVVDPFTSTLQNITRTHLAGPEIGIRYDLGGEHFGIWGQTKFGVMANHESSRLNGNNIGAALKGHLLPATPDNPLPNSFFDDEEHTHVSPLFEQSIFFEGRVFQYVPLINRMHLFNEANLRIGYTIIVVGSMTRPSESIEWDGNPSANLFPSIDVERGTWHTSNWSFGIDWTF